MPPYLQEISSRNYLVDGFLLLDDDPGNSLRCWMRARTCYSQKLATTVAANSLSSFVKSCSTIRLLLNKCSSGDLVTTKQFGRNKSRDRVANYLVPRPLIPLNATDDAQHCAGRQLRQTHSLVARPVAHPAINYQLTYLGCRRNGGCGRGAGCHSGRR